MMAKMNMPNQGDEVTSMNQKAAARNFAQGLDELAAMPDFVRAYARILTQPQSRKSPWGDPETEKSLKKIKESLVFAFLVTNLNFKNIPLKVFMDDIEKEILLACLRLTGGSQKNAAAVLSLKPTALFEKMRKHGIRSQRLKLHAEPEE
jgi:DNA-binding NtrC family response regulator